VLLLERFYKILEQLVEDKVNITQEESESGNGPVCE
jgi:hypothetical protein